MNIKARLTVVKVVFLLFAVLLSIRLFYWQGIKAQELSNQARLQHRSGNTVLAPRGSVMARDGSWLAVSLEGWLVFASKPEISEDPKAIAAKLAPFFVEDDHNEETNEKERLFDEQKRLEELLSKRDGVWIPLKHKVSTETKKNIEAMKILGIGFDKQEVRKYPESSLSAHLLGFVGKDDDGNDKGYFGLEGYYDLPLSGKPGFISRESDARGAPIVFGDSKEISAVGGADLVTHIDKTIQIIVERKLKDGIEKYGAVSGNAVVMDPKTGGILAMASFPSYDPLKYYDFESMFFKNPVISDAFEPGSIFKPLIMAAGLDAGVVSPDTVCDKCSGPMIVDKYSIETWDNKYYPNSTMREVILHSDNVGMTFVGSRLGAERLYDYLYKFGIGKQTNIDLQGEANPGLREKGTWNVVDLATATFGQGVAVTPIQMVKAVSVIANKGVGVTPKVVDKIKSQEWEEEIDPEIGERVISQKAAEEMTQIMIDAVKSGEAKWAVPKGFKVAGKTGTAQIPLLGHYDAEKTNASFIGFAPPADPRFVMLITLREPKSSPWASETSAPLWFSIAKEIFPYLGIQPGDD